jgi:acylpyruvate hydrolase
MRLATVRTGTSTSAARVAGDHFELLPFDDVGALLASGLAADSVEPVDRIAVGMADLAPVIPRPGKILCLGLNYRAHILESGRDLPTYPTLFAKFSEALIGPTDDIELPSAAVSEQVDWEAELVIVVGQTVRHADARQAGEAIAGFTAMNDITVRDWQRRTIEWLQGKTFEGTTPLGPTLVTTDELGDGSGLDISCTVNGEVMQQATTSDLLFSPVDIIRYVSTIVTLRPGDIIATGTPGGVGVARAPQIFLRPGDVVETTVTGIGTMRNVCHANERSN